MMLVKPLVTECNGVYCHKKNDFPIILFYVFIVNHLFMDSDITKKNIKSIINNIYSNQLSDFLLLK